MRLIICICIHQVNTKTAQIPWKILVDVLYRSKHYSMRNRSWETSGWTITCPGRVMSTKCLPCDTVQPMEAALQKFK